MQNVNILQQNYTTFSRPYQLKLPFEIEGIIPDNDCVRLLDWFVEELDLSDLYATYSRVKENQVSPRQMLKIVLYAYHEGLYSSRKIESACRRDINFMYLLEGRPAPDHATIARFRTIHFAPLAEKYLAQMTLFLKEIGEIDGKNLFLDGTKIEACANKYTFVWKKTVTKNQARMLERAAALVQECVECYGLKPVWQGRVKVRHLKKLKKRLLRIKEEEGIGFVHGQGHHKSRLQRQYEELEYDLEKLKEYDRKLHTMGKRNSYSKTDPDATFMRMKEDAMRNGQLKPAYNLQLGVDSSYITWLTISERPADTLTLMPFIVGMEQALRFRYETVVADAGYESEENYNFLESLGIRAMIKPKDYEISKTRRYQREIGRAENMEYHEAGDYYVCRNGKELHRSGQTHPRTTTGMRRTVTEYSCKDCGGCPFKAQCITGKHWKVPFEERTKTIRVSREMVRYREECRERITSEEGIQLRINRSIQAEGAFALMKEDRQFRRFLCRGKCNVLAESILMAMSQNIGTLHRKIQAGRLGTHLYPVHA